MATTANPEVIVNTNYGHFLVELFPEQAPGTVTNFLSYIDENFYTDTIFHRVIDQFMIQGGGLGTDLLPKAVHAPIVLESNNGLSNLRGTLAMARTGVADSATSQFFVNTVDNLFLNYASTASPGYAVFGQVLDGMDVVDAIGAAHTFSVRASNSVVYEDMPFPKLIEILGVERYTLSTTQVATTHQASSDANGVNQAVFSGVRADYGVRLNSDGSHSVTLLDGAHSSETVNSHRLIFDDSKLAYDIHGSAGEAALLINATFGFSYLQPAINGIGLTLFDMGFSMQEVAAAALTTDLWKTVAGGTDNASFVKAVYSHVVGSAPDAATQAAFQSILDQGVVTQAQLLVAAAQTDVNVTFIDLIGIGYSGLEFV